jgi:hypothetical protein
VHSPVRRALGSLLLVLSLPSAACVGPAPSGQPGSTGAATSSADRATSSSAAATTSEPVTVPLSGGPVLAVKIDNTPPARPRIGLDRADVVYVEPVESGLTRLLAVFSTSMPAEVGPVRSARESDVDLLANYGPVAFAFSGASAGTLAKIATGTQVNLSNDASGRGFLRLSSRPAPYNLLGQTGALLARAEGSVPPGDIGWRFGAAPDGGQPATSVATAYGASSVSASWDPAPGRYRIATDGRAEVAADGTQVAAATVIVQTVRVGASANRDVNGIATPLVSVVGQGAVTVLRDGRSWAGTWTRPSPAAPTALHGADGRAIALAGTPVWVLLVAEGQPVTIR